MDDEAFVRRLAEDLRREHGWRSEFEWSADALAAGLDPHEAPRRFAALDELSEALFGLELASDALQKAASAALRGDQAADYELAQSRFLAAQKRVQACLDAIASHLAA